MSALGVQSEPPPADQSTFGTKDPILAATLGNFGFLARHSIPVLLVVSSAGVIDLVDKKTGRVEDCTHLEFRFEAFVRDPVLGNLSAHTISLAHEIAKLAQKEETKEITGAEALQVQQLRQQWQRMANSLGSHAGTLLWAVQKLYDQITNFIVVCTVTKELARNPLIEYSKQVYRGVAYAVEPMESEPVTQRRVEKLFRK